MVRRASLKDLDDSTDRWAVVVRVFRKWNVYQKSALAELFCVSMVLIDEEGNTIQASVLNKNLHDKYRLSIIQGQIYKFANFEVTPNVSQYRATSHPFKMTFTTMTFSAEDNATIPSYAYSFLPISEIMKIDFRHPVYNLFDVLAFVKDVGTLDEFCRGNETKNRLCLLLADSENNEVECTLFDDCALDAYMAYLQNAESPVVVLLNLARVGFSEDGTPQVCSSFNATRAFFNPSIIEGDSFVINCHILKLETRHGWCYDGCSKCGSKATSPSSICPLCKKKPDSIEPKMKIHYLVRDETGSASVIFWDKLAVQLVKKTASELIHLLKEDDNFLDALDLPVGKKVLLKMKLNDYNKQHPTSSISVSQYTICEDLLNQFNEANTEGIVETVDAQNGAENIFVNPMAEGVTPLATPLEDSTINDLSQHVSPAPVKGKIRITNKRNVVKDDLTTNSHMPSAGPVEERSSKVIKQEK